MILRHIKTGETMEAVVREGGRIILVGTINDPGDLAGNFTIGKCSNEELRNLHRHSPEPSSRRLGRAASCSSPTTQR